MNYISLIKKIKSTVDKMSEAEKEKLKQFGNDILDMPAEELSRLLNLLEQLRREML